MKNLYLIFSISLLLFFEANATTPIISVTQIGTSNSVSVVWGETDVTISPGVTLNRFQISYNLVGQSATVIDNISSASRSYTIGGLTYGSSYEVRIIEVIRVDVPLTPYTPPYIDNFNASATFTFSALNRPPVALCRDVIKNVNNNCQASVTVSDANNGSYDPDFDPLNMSITASGMYGIGTYYFTLNVDDGKGASSSCQFKFTAKDGTPPYIITKSEIVYLKENGKGYLQVSDIDNGTFDACSDHVKFLKPREYTCKDVGFHQVYLYARDAWGNLDSAKVQIEVRDNLKPYIYNHDITLTLNAQGFVDFDWTKSDFKVYDNCQIAYVTLSKTRFIKADNNTKVNMTAMDIHGNAQAHEFKVFVADPALGNTLIVDLPNVSNPTTNVSNGIGENNLFNISPNPAATSATISILDKETDTARLYISKESGLVEQINLSNLKNEKNVHLDLSNYAVGSYLITIFTENSRKTSRLQVVK